MLKINTYPFWIINMTPLNKSYVFNETKPHTKPRRTKPSWSIVLSNTLTEKATSCSKSLRKLEKNKIKNSLWSPQGVVGSDGPGERALRALRQKKRLKKINRFRQVWGKSRGVSYRKAQQGAMPMMRIQPLWEHYSLQSNFTYSSYHVLAWASTISGHGRAGNAMGQRGEGPSPHPNSATALCWPISSSFFLNFFI